MTDTTKDAGNTEQATATRAAQSECNGLLPVLLPYHAHTHNKRHKCHVRSSVADTALCGFEHPCYASNCIERGATIVDLEWLNQADPDNHLCKHCVSIGRKLISR